MRLATSLAVYAVALALFAPAPRARAQDAAPLAAPQVAAPPVAPGNGWTAPAATDTAPGGAPPVADQWITYKNDLQRTGASAAHAGLAAEPHLAAHLAGTAADQL